MARPGHRAGRSKHGSQGGHGVIDGWRNYVSWLVAFGMVLVALLLLGASAQAWVAYAAIVGAIVLGLAVQAVARRQRH